MPKLAEMRDTGLIGEFTTLARIIPSSAAQEANLAAHQEALASQSSSIEAVMARIGVRAQAMQLLPSRGAVTAGEVLATSTAMPFRHLRINAEGGIAHLITFYPPAPRDHTVGEFETVLGPKKHSFSEVRN
jgi:predicted exporter